MFKILSLTDLAVNFCQSSN